MILPVRPHFIFDLLPQEKREDFIIPVPCRESGSPTMLEWALLVAVGRIVEAGSERGIFELGTYKGQTARMLARNFLIWPPVVTTLDLNPELAEKNSDINFLQGHSCAFDFTPYHGKMSLVFIDGGHDTMTVSSDSGNALKLLSPEGPAAIVWHDYDPLLWSGVCKAVDQFANLGLLVYRVEDTRLAIYLRALPPQADQQKGVPE